MRARSRKRTSARPPASARSAPRPTTTAESVGQLLYALQRKPPRTPYVIAAVLALLWLAGGAAVTALLFNLEPADSSTRPPIAPIRR